MKMVGKVTMIAFCKIDISADVPSQTLFYTLWCHWQYVSCEKHNCESNVWYIDTCLSAHTQNMHH